MVKIAVPSHIVLVGCAFLLTFVFFVKWKHTAATVDPANTQSVASINSRNSHNKKTTADGRLSSHCGFLYIV